MDAQRAERLTAEADVLVQALYNESRAVAMANSGGRQWGRVCHALRRALNRLARREALAQAQAFEEARS